MIRFQDLPIRKKLITMIMFTSSTALILAGVSFVFYDYRLAKHALQQEIEVLTDIIAHRSTAALSFQDRQLAMENLNALQAANYIKLACIFDKQGQLFAIYPAYERSLDCAVAPEAEVAYFERGYFHRVNMILLDDSQIGSLYVKTDLLMIRKKLFYLSVGVLVILLLVAGTSLWMSSRLQRVVSDPLSRLAHAAKMISAQNQKWVRAAKESEDEFGTLVDAFNEMLDKIESQNQQLSDAKDNLERQVLQRTAELEVANTELEAFGYSVSHDLRTPLRSIDGFSQILIEDYSEVFDEQGRNYLAKVRAASQRMGNLIDDLLSLSHTSRLPMQREKVNLSLLIQEYLTILQENHKDRKFVCEIESDVSAYGDARLLRIVFENLLNNVVKFTMHKPYIHIEFGVKKINGKSCYYLRDNGAGFDMRYAEKLFGAFQRLHTEEEFPGTGIGLATVARVIHKHGGKIWAEGWVDKGAVFWFTLGN